MHNEVYVPLPQHGLELEGPQILRTKFMEGGRLVLVSHGADGVNMALYLGPRPFQGVDNNVGLDSGQLRLSCANIHDLWCAACVGRETVSRGGKRGGGRRI